MLQILFAGLVFVIAIPLAMASTYVSLKLLYRFRRSYDRYRERCRHINSEV